MPCKALLLSSFAPHEGKILSTAEHGAHPFAKCDTKLGSYAVVLPPARNGFAWGCGQRSIP